MSRSPFARFSIPIALLALSACGNPPPNPGADASLPDATPEVASDAPLADAGPDADAPDPDAPEPTACDPEPDGGMPRPKWTEQPNRITPTVSGTYSSSGIPISNSDGGVIGGIVACDPTKLGQYPKAEGGNPNPKGADLQNISTNFHALQSLELLSSVLSKAVAKMNKFSTDLNELPQKGACVCNTLSGSCTPSVENTREECDTACAGSCGGVKNWVSTDVFLQNNGDKKWAMKTMGLLDSLHDIMASPTFTAITNALSAFGASVDNMAEILAKSQCWIDLFSEGYHLGGYDKQRPDLHMCVGYYGHGAFAGLAENDRFDIGGRYTSHNLSKDHRAQMRTGGWGITAFGRNLSILPNFEFNTQVDGYKFFDKCKPLGMSIGGDPSVGCPGGVGFWVGSGPAPAGTVDANKVDIFQLVDKPKLKKLDSDGNNIITAGEFLVAGYQPFKYPNASTGPYQWPRAAFEDYEWEAPVSSVISAGLNLNPHITPIEKILGTYTIYPGVIFVPKLTLKAGADWKYEAYLQRQRLLEALNKNLAPSLKWQTAAFDRNMHSMQAPDVSDDTGVSAYVTPGVQAQLTVGMVISKWLEIGISAFVGLEVDIRPGAFGGVLDASLPLVTAINNSNPPDGPCSPVLETKKRTVCSDKLVDTAKPTHSDPTKTYACQSSSDKGSCCIKFTTKTEQSLCIDAWTGISKDVCNCPEGLDKCYEKIKPYVISAKARDLIESALANATVSSFTMNWNDTKTCAQCDKDKTCTTADWARTPELLELSDCSRHGYCVPPGGGDTIYDVVEEDCTKARGTFYRYQCVDELSTEITRWEGPGCHPLNSGFPSACGCMKDGDCATGETCDAASGKCSSTPATCACDPAVPSSCGAGRSCVEGACLKTCAVDTDCKDGLKCSANKCVSKVGTPYAEQIVWQTAHPSATGPQHAVETYALTDLQLKMLLSTGIRIGATIKLFKKPRDFLIWAWSKAWDVGSLQKAKYQPGLESSYLEECSSSVGTVTNHQPGAAAGITCSGGNNKVCRYPDGASASWASYDQPDELIAVCKGDMPNDREDPMAVTPGDFGDSMTDLTSFGLDVGESQWNAHQLCVGEKGQPLVDWLKNPADQVNGSCNYKGTTPGAPASFPCKDLEKYSMQIWGCLNTTSGAGLTVKNTIQAKVPATASTYLVTPTYSSSLTSAQTIDLHALVPDPWATPATAVFAPAVWTTLTALEQLQFRQWLTGVEQCYDAHFQAESACKCTASTGCNTAAGETCSGGTCQTSSGTIATCPFLEFGTAADVHPCCGDGVVTSAVGEQCDDGNTVSGDGCNLECKSERAGAACCTNNGCVDISSASATKECNAKGGSAFAGKTCKELNYCGHPTVGSCTGPDMVCHQPSTEKQCSAIKGTFSTAACPK